MKTRFCLLALLLPVALPAAEDVWLSATVNVRDADQEHARPVLDKNARNQPLRIASQEFAKGFGTQADNRSAVSLNGAVRFTALAGVDDATESDAPIRFEVLADGNRSGATS